MFDVIIPVGNNDVSFVARVVDFINRCFIDAETIYIITSKKNINKVRKHVRKSSDCVIIEEDQLLMGLSIERVGSLLRAKTEKTISPGWYFQQFLKFAFARSNYCKNYYLSWDADTLPLAPIQFFNNGHPLFNPKKEYNPNYFKTIKNLLGYDKVIEDSFIAEHMLFDGKIVREMLDKIESSDIFGSDWIEKVINACDFNNVMPAFSEFETYGTYCFTNYPNMYQRRHLNTFREAGFICGRNIDENRLRIMSFDIDTASFEMRHAPMFPYNIPNITYKIKLFFIKCSKKKISDLCTLIFQRKNRQMKRKEMDDIIYRLPDKNIN